jgi:hypothetical protein
MRCVRRKLLNRRLYEHTDIYNVTDASSVTDVF